MSAFVKNLTVLTVTKMISEIRDFIHMVYLVYIYNILQNIKIFILFSPSPQVFFLFFSLSVSLGSCVHVKSYIYISLRRSIYTNYISLYVIFIFSHVIYSFFFVSLFSTTKFFYFPPKNISHILLLASLFDFNFLPEPVLYCILMLMLVCIYIYILNMFQSIILTCWCSTINLRSS